MKEQVILYESFNARYLTFNEIANTFIINDHYLKLIQNNHSLLMGPRGCGKTTLLKMLSLPAIYSYDKEFKQNLKERIPFRSVYIPTDIQWRRQLDVLEKTIQSVDTVNLISKSTLLITILQSLCKTFSEILYYEVGLGENCSELEVELSKNLIDNWKLQKPIVPTLRSIEIHLIRTISDLNAQINKHLLLETEITFDELFYFEYFDLFKIGCETFSSIVPITKKKWALSFDELEIAPQWLQTDLLGSLRSRDQNYIFKLTTAPVISLYQEADQSTPQTDPTEGNDYNVIKVWTSDQKDLKEWRVFCDKLMTTRISRRISKEKIKSPQEIFGESYLEYSLKEAYPGVKLEYDRDDFEPNTPTWFAVKELASKDKSFEIFLRTKGINPENPVPKDIHQEDEIFRKIKQLVIFRLHLKRNTTELRSRKVVPLYFGLTSVYEFCDGNPRVLIGLMDEFLGLSIQEDGSMRKLSINEQSRILTKLSERYLLILSSHPDATVNINGTNYNVVDLINKIASYNYNKAIVEKFRMDQVGSFKIDAELANKLLSLLEFGLYLGAFVYIDNVNSIDHNGILNKKFRLTYALCPYFKLIPRNKRSVTLSSILNDKHISQQSLFDIL